MQKKPLKKAGEELTPDKGLFKVAELPGAGADPGAFPDLVSGPFSD